MIKTIEDFVKPNNAELLAAVDFQKRFICELIDELYKEQIHGPDLRASLINDGVERLEVAYVKGWQHALSELKVRIQHSKVL